MKTTRIFLVTALVASLGAGAAQAQGTKPATTPTKRDTTHAAQSTSMSPASHASSTSMAPAPGNAAPSKHWTKDQIEDAQKGLAKGGYYKGAVNGTWTHATASALRAYQRANKMPVTGQLTDEELTKLKAS